MKRLLLASAALAAMTSASLAADYAAPVEEVDVWSGFFVGIAGGYAFKDVDVDVDDGSFEDDFESDDFIIGAYYGRNWQMDNLVFGIDSSFNYIGMEEDDILADVGGDELDLEANFLGLSRLKVGFAFDNTLVYVAGGLATTIVEVDEVGTGEDDDDWAFGWTIGGGVEHKFSDNWSARIEAAYFSIESDEIEFATAGPVDLELDGVIIRGGVAYHF
jgi:outer membrane immunogenic protein